MNHSQINSISIRRNKIENELGEKILYKLLIFNINMIQKSCNENWQHSGRRLRGKLNY